MEIYWNRKSLCNKIFFCVSLCYTGTYKIILVAPNCAKTNFVNSIIEKITFGYCRTGNFHDRKISRNRGVGWFTTGKLRKYWDRGPSQLWNNISEIFVNRRFSRNARKFPAREDFLFYSTYLRLDLPHRSDAKIANISNL